MGWISDLILDWLAIDVFERITRRLPGWGAALLLVLPLTAVITLLWLFVR
jgi:hypothetical protein